MGSLIRFLVEHQDLLFEVLSVLGLGGVAEWLRRTFRRGRAAIDRIQELEARLERALEQIQGVEQRSDRLYLQTNERLRSHVEGRARPH